MTAFQKASSSGRAQRYAVRQPSFLIGRIIYCAAAVMTGMGFASRNTHPVRVSPSRLT
jgi:hypothetical protein